MSGSRNRKQAKRRRQRQQRQAASAERPILVHAPRQPPGIFAPPGRYEAACNGKVVETPPGVVFRTDPDGDPYIVAGPNPRYYRGCPRCFG